MADLIDYTQETIKQTQSDVLTGNLKNNDLMKPSPILPLNKALKGTQPNIINAINEVLAKSNTTDTKFVNFADFYNKILLDINTPTGQTKYNDMLQIGDTVIEAIVNLNKSSSKTICFQFFRVDSTINQLIIRCPYNAKINKIIANTNLLGSLDTELIIEKINELDFKNKIDNWTNILSSNLFIRNGQVVDDESYAINVIDVTENDLFRIGLIGSTDIKNLNVQIELNVI